VVTVHQHPINIEQQRAFPILSRHAGLPFAEYGTAHPGMRRTASARCQHDTIPGAVHRIYRTIAAAAWDC
jgi:hypothetical protein